MIEMMPNGARRDQDVNDFDHHAAAVADLSDAFVAVPDVPDEAEIGKHVTNDQVLNDLDDWHVVVAVVVIDHQHQHHHHQLLRQAYANLAQTDSINADNRLDPIDRIHVVDRHDQFDVVALPMPTKLHMKSKVIG